MCHAMTIVRIHKDKTPVRRHYINEWAEHYRVSKADIARGTGAERSLVTKWFKGVMPGEKYLQQIAALFEVEADALFRHPDDDWLARFFKERAESEKKAARLVLETMFPPKTGTSD